MNPELVIGLGRVREAEQILKLQYLCFQGEAALYDHYGLAPLTQTLQALLEEYDTHVILVARLGHEVVGSVRGRVVGATCEIGRLMVHPRLQGSGLGTRLMQAMEDAVPNVLWYELFTGHRSEHNLRLYRRLGYRELWTEEVSPSLQLIYLRKAAGGG